MENEESVDGRDRFVTEQVCQLRHKDVVSLGVEINELKADLKLFRENDLKHLSDGLSSLNTWTAEHDKGQKKGISYIGLAVNLGGWFVAILTVILLLIKMYK